MPPSTTTPLYNPATRRIHYLTTDGLPPNEGRPPQTGDSVPPHRSTAQASSQHPPPARHYSATPHPSTYTPPRARAWPNMDHNASRATSQPLRPVLAMREPPPPYRANTPGSAFRPQQQPSRQHASGQVAGQTQAQTQTQATLIWIPWTTQQGGSWRYVTRDGGVPFGGQPPPWMGGAGHGSG